MNKFMLSLFTVSVSLITAVILSCYVKSPDTQVCSGEEYDPDEYACIRGELVPLDESKVSSSGGGNGGGNSSPSGSSSSNRPAGSSSGTQVTGGNPDIDYGQFTDARDGKTYLTVEIGTQTWMAQNLNYKYHELGPTCYNDKESNCDKYGMLYEYYDAVRICPAGWHLPTRPEWDALLSQVGSTPGKKLKAISEDWRDGDGTDDHGFGALPGGALTSEFSELNIAGYWWTATDRNRVQMTGGNGVSFTTVATRTNQYSVRCILGSSSSAYPINYGELTDARDGKKYRTVKIGTQNWMAENLNYETANSQCYNNKGDNCEIYGRMYDQETAKTNCPEDWKLPTRSEWDALLSYIDDLRGRKLKARSDLWRDDGYGIDLYGFGALPGGALTSEFSELNIAGYWWTATDRNRAQITSGDGVNFTTVATRTNQYSVRCIEDL